MPGAAMMDSFATPSDPPTASWWRRAQEWLRRQPPADSRPVPAARPRLPQGLGVQRRAEPAELRARVAERVRLLASAARTSYENFLMAACYVDDPPLAAWLSDCARQRRWIASELHGLLAATDLTDHACPTWQSSIESVSPWSPPGTPGSALEHCARAEALVLTFYEELLAGPLPVGLAPILMVQLIHVREVSDRLLQMCPPPRQALGAG